jgi:hypothetical protein
MLKEEVQEQPVIEEDNQALFVDVISSNNEDN